MSTAKEKVLVLDSSAFIMGLDPFYVNLKLFTTPEVVSELSSFWLQLRYSTAVNLKKLVIVSPQKKFLTKVEKASKETGDKPKLSKVDLSVLALALELKVKGYKPTIISDDYSVQNVADYLGIDYAYLSGRGIKRRIRWVWYCPGCGRRFSSTSLEKVCPVCGVEVKRKAYKKTSREEK